MSSFLKIKNKKEKQKFICPHCNNPYPIIEMKQHFNTCRILLKKYKDEKDKMIHEKMTELENMKKLNNDCLDNNLNNNLNNNLSYNNEYISDIELKKPILDYKTSFINYPNYQKNEVVFIFGNDASIENISFDEIDILRKNNKIITAGVNRIWLKHLPDYFFFMDHPIPQELYKALNNKKISYDQINNMNIITSSHNIRKSDDYMNFINEFDCKLYKLNKLNSVNNLIWYMYHENPNRIFYINGVSLQWNEKHHFWCNKKYSEYGNNKSEFWTMKRFNKSLEIFKDMYNNGIKMISLTRNSRLNNIIPYQDYNTVISYLS